MAHPGQDPVLARAMRRNHRHAGVFGNLVVAVDAGDFLDQIDLSRQIAPPEGRNHLDPIFFGPQLAIAQGRENLAGDIVAGTWMPKMRWICA